MVVALADKIENLQCSVKCKIKEDLDIKNYGLTICVSNGLSKFDKNPKFNKIKLDLLNYYNKFNSEELHNLETECSILKLIKKI